MSAIYYSYSLQIWFWASTLLRATLQRVMQQWAILLRATLLLERRAIININISPTDCHASGPDAPYECRYFVPLAVSPSGVWAKPVLVGVLALPAKPAPIPRAGDPPSPALPISAGKASYIIVTSLSASQC